MKFVFAGGGTMGHLSPSLAIAKEHARHQSTGDCLFVGREGGGENAAIQKAGFPLYTLAVTGFIGKNPKQILGSFHSMRSAIQEVTVLLKEEAPDCVIGTGGYVSYPVLVAAARLGIPTVLHESNATPGLAAKLLSRRVDCVLLGMPDCEEAFSKRVHTVYTGTPVAPAFYTTNREQARRRLGVKERRLILSFGGSLGAEGINRFVKEGIASVDARTVLWIHAAGRRYYDTMRRECPDTEGFRLLPYIEDMPTYLTAADLALCRAGASTIAELAATGTPAILIPSPHVAANHQAKNAEHLCRKGQARVLTEEASGTSEGIRILQEAIAALPKEKAAPPPSDRAEKRALKVICDLVEKRGKRLP